MASSRGVRRRIECSPQGRQYVNRRRSNQVYFSKEVVCKNRESEDFEQGLMAEERQEAEEERHCKCFKRQSICRNTQQCQQKYRQEQDSEWRTWDSVASPRDERIRRHRELPGRPYARRRRFILALAHLARRRSSSVPICRLHEGHIRSIQCTVSVDEVEGAGASR